MADFSSGIRRDLLVVAKSSDHHSEWNTFLAMAFHLFTVGADVIGSCKAPAGLVPPWVSGVGWGLSLPLACGYRIGGFIQYICFANAPFGRRPSCRYMLSTT